MPISYPSSLDTFTNPISSDTLNSVPHATQHSNANDAISALEAKVGANSSAVTTSHDYKLSGVTGTDKAVSKTGTETLTNKTLTAPQINMGSDTTGDIYYRTSGGATARLPIGSTGQILDVSSAGIPEWAANPSASDASTTVKGVVEIATAAEITAGTSTGATGAKLVVSPDQLVSAAPTFSGANLTNIPNPAIYKNGVTTYDLTTASGTQNIAHGLGTTPKKIKITWVYEVLDSATLTNRFRGVGVYNGTTKSSINEGTVPSGGGGSANYNTSTSSTYIVLYSQGGGGSELSQKAVPTFDATNIILTWTKVGSPTGTILILWEAEI
jgi:hypothetical protein